MGNKNKYEFLVRKNINIYSIQYNNLLKRQILKVGEKKGDFLTQYLQ